jgi:predicted DNA-binding ribbon-helix-helix protein
MLFSRSFREGNVRKIGIPEADWSTLEALAAQEGTTPSALIRKAIKDLLRRQRAGPR